MTAWLRTQGYRVNPKRVARRLRTMGLGTRSRRPRLRQPHPAHRISPSALRGVPMRRVDQVWSTDITSIRLRGGCVSLVAVMDWFRRSVLAWALSITQEVGLCLEALDEALGRGRPEVLNSDQGSQCTSRACTGRLEAAGITISMDGRGRALDNVFVERLWRTVKYEEVYVHEYETPREATQGLRRYFEFSNGQRLHQALAYRTPAAVSVGNTA
jgi:putative transposase